MRRALIIMAKCPTPGEVKTRLAPPLSIEQAAHLYTCFLADTIAVVRQVTKLVPNVQPVIAFTPSTAHGFFATLAPDFDLVQQRGPNLSHRLANIFNICLRSFDQVAAISSDSPTVPAGVIATAYSTLAEPHVDAVFGPCDDGGYYLIALDHPRPQLILGVQMSTPHVMRDTLDIARQENVNVAQLPVWYDVDTVAELYRLNKQLDKLDATIAHHTRTFLDTLSLPQAHS